jgi:hypothetical protein
MLGTMTDSESSMRARSRQEGKASDARQFTFFCFVQMDTAGTSKDVVGVRAAPQLAGQPIYCASTTCAKHTRARIQGQLQCHRGFTHAWTKLQSEHHRPENHNDGEAAPSNTEKNKARIAMRKKAQGCAISSSFVCRVCADRSKGVPKSSTYVERARSNGEKDGFALTAKRCYSLPSASSVLLRTQPFSVQTLAQSGRA